MRVEPIDGKCATCKHMREISRQYPLCFVGPISRPLSYQRNVKGACGPNAAFWKAKE